MKDIVFQVLNGPFAAYKKKRVLVVKHTHFVRCHQLSACKLVVGGVAPVSPTRTPVGVGVDCLLAQELGNILVGALLVTTEIEKFIMR
jgi:hypothetical protein